MSLMGERVRIRSTREEDLGFLQALWNDGTVMRYQGYPDGMHVSDEALHRWWQAARHADQAHGGLAALPSPHAIVELLDGTPIGELTYSRDARRRVSLDLKLASAYCGQGYAFETMRVLLHELFAATDVETAISEPAPDNDRAHRLLRRCGFHPDPTENHPHRWACGREDFARAMGAAR